MEIPILSGRGLLVSDDADSARVAVVNETLAARSWPGRDAVGKRFQMDGEPGSASGQPWVEVVGVARTSAYGYFAEPPQDMVYFPFRQVPARQHGAPGPNGR